MNTKKIQIEIELGEEELYPKNCRGCRFDLHGSGCSLLSEIDEDGEVIGKEHKIDPYTSVDEWCPLKNKGAL